jgi:hypothetical protein
MAQQLTKTTGKEKHLALDREIHGQFKTEAARIGVRMFDAATEAAKDWIRKPKKQMRGKYAN